MKTAVSVPDGLLVQADRLARRTNRTRSQLYSAALREYVARHSSDEVTEVLDQVVADIDLAGPDRFARAAARSALDSSEW